MSVGTMRPDVLIEEQLTHSIIGASFEVFRALGPGRRENVYSRAMEAELGIRRHDVAREFSARVFYKGREIATERLDMVVDGRVVVEIKAGDALPPSAVQQVYGYLRSTNLSVGLVIHFGPTRASFRRVIRDH